MASGPVTGLFNSSFPRIGLTTNMAAHTNQSRHLPGNWSVPEGCQMVLFSQMDSWPGNNPDGVVSADTRRLVHQTKNCMLLLLFLIGGPSNVINMAVFYKQGLRDRVTLCLFFLALTDALYLTSSMIFQGEELYTQFRSEEEVGSHFAFVINNHLLIFLGAYYASPILSAIVAVERCLCVFNPLKFQNLMRARTMGVIICMVYISVYSLSFVLFIRFRIECLYDPIFRLRVRAAVEGEFYRANADLINVMEGAVFGVGVVGGTVIAVTISTAMTAMKLRQISQWRSESTLSISSREVALTKMLVGSSVVFIICVFPFALFNFVRLFLPEVDYGQKDHNLYICCAWIGETFVLLKPCSNIFVYYSMGSRYRETFWSVFRRKARQ